MAQNIIFDKSAIKKLLLYFNKSIDSEGYIIEHASKKRVLSFDGKEIDIEDFGGIVIGSEIFIKSDIDSVVKFLEKTSNA